MKLSDIEITGKLERLPGWKHQGNAITKQFIFNDFKEAVEFVNSVAEIAESADHHPDITINYKKVTLILSTHSEGGVTQKDFDLAEQIENSL
jgi:4a-hydroxytetrahydrobiopterin dehydratase